MCQHSSGRSPPEASLRRRVESAGGGDLAFRLPPRDGSGAGRFFLLTAPHRIERSWHYLTCADDAVLRSCVSRWQAGARRKGLVILRPCCGAQRQRVSPCQSPASRDHSMFVMSIPESMKTEIRLRGVRAFLFTASVVMHSHPTLCTGRCAEILTETELRARCWDLWGVVWSQVRLQ